MKKELCKNCGFYYEYYTKGYNRFNKTRHGFCNKRHQTTDNNKTCEFWKGNEKRKEARQEICLATLETAVNNIKEIVQILKEQE